MVQLLIVDSGASTNFVAEVVEDIPKRNCGDYVVTGAFPGNRSFNQLVSLGFWYNGLSFRERFAVLRNFDKN